MVDLTGAVVRRSPDPRSRNNSIDFTAASAFSSRLNSVTSEDDLAATDVPSNYTTSTDVTSTLSPAPLPKPPSLASPAKPPTLVRVLPHSGSLQATAAAMENPGFIASPDAAHPGDSEPTRRASKTTSGESNRFR